MFYDHFEDSSVIFQRLVKIGECTHTCAMNALKMPEKCVRRTGEGACVGATGSWSLVLPWRA